MPKKANLIGQKFNRLTVVAQTDERKNGSVVWLCRCDCGKYTRVSTRALRSNEIKSCGCLYKETRGRNVKDITGRRFGKLVALYPTEKRDKEQRVIWMCKCDCGNMIEVSTHQLSNGDRLSCGCLKSRGEAAILSLLNKNNIKVEPQKKVSFTKYDYGIFDFYLPQNGAAIEYDGIQHFEEVDRFGGKEAFEKTQKRDQIKNQWCKNNNITLIRIPYTHLKDLKIEDLLPETSSFII